MRWYDLRKVQRFPFSHSSINPVLFILQSLPEPFLEQRELGDEIGYGVHQSVVGRVVRGGLDPDHDFVLHRVRVLVAGKENIRVL